MSRTSTRIVNIQALASRPGASTVIKLMMACNDLSLANETQADWGSERSSARMSRVRGAQMYFVRLQISHLNEGQKTIREVYGEPALMRIVGECDAQTQASFAKLAQCVSGGVQEKEFAKMAGRIRQNLGFHYDESGKLITKALADRMAIHGERPSSITRGSTAHLWYFELADEILDRVVVREIWKIPESADLRLEADKIALWIHEVNLAFVDFCGEFILKFVGR